MSSTDQRDASLEETVELKAPAWLGDEDDDGDEPELELAPEPAVAGESVLAALKAQRESMGDDRHFDYVPRWWRGLLVLRFGAVSPSAQTAIANRIMATKGKQVPNANLDTLIAAFQCGLGRSTPTGELEVIPAPDGEPATLKELVEVLGLGTVDRARDAMRLIFAGANSPETALTALGSDWNEWASNENEEADDAFMGES